MCIDRCIGMCTNMCVGMYIQTCVDIDAPYVTTCVYTYVCTCVWSFFVHMHVTGQTPIELAHKRVAHLLTHAAGGHRIALHICGMSRAGCLAWLTLTGLWPLICQSFPFRPFRPPARLFDWPAQLAGWPGRPPGRATAPPAPPAPPTLRRPRLHHPACPILLAPPARRACAPPPPPPPTHPHTRTPTTHHPQLPASSQQAHTHMHVRAHACVKRPKAWARQRRAKSSQAIRKYNDQISQPVGHALSYVKEQLCLCWGRCMGHISA